MTNRIILHGESQRRFAKGLIDIAPERAVVTIAQPSRTVIQNAKVWAMLGDISKQLLTPRGSKATADVWKCIVMHACDHESQFEIGLNGNPFPVGFRSSQLNIGQCADLITFMYQLGDERGVVWSDDEIRRQVA